MAVTITDDAVQINSCDALDASRFNTGSGVNNPTAADTAIFVQGTASWRARVTGATLGGVGDDFGVASTLLVGTPPTGQARKVHHILVWAKTLDAVTVADGWRIRYATGVDTNANYREISAGGLDTSRNVVKGFFCYAVDPLFPQMNQNGTPPTLANGRSFALLANHTSNSSRDTFFLDEIKHIAFITVTGGAATPRGAPEIAADDNTNGRGTFVDVNGVFYVLGGIVIGDITAATNSTFEDSNKVWVFQDGSFSGGFHYMEFVGGTGTNAATFGSLTGSGITAAGSSGNVFLAGGNVPFHVKCVDADTAVAFYGCNFLGPTAMYASPFRAMIEEDAGTGFTDETFAASNAVDTDANLLPATQAIDDAAFFGNDTKFEELSIDAAALATGVWDLTWEYSLGSDTWAALTDVTDGTAKFRTAGEQTVSFEVPDDWAVDTINSQGPYYFIRARISAFTSSGVRPTADFIRVKSGGRIELEQVNADMISCAMTNMDTVSVRNGSLFRKCSIIANVSNAKNGALDLGAADPVADSVRDIIIQNCNKGILLKDFTRFFNAAAAVDKGAGKVGIPDTAHGFATGQSILIAGTTNYNGTFTVDATSSANEIVITATFVAETFAVTDSAVPNTTYNFRNIVFAGNTKNVRVDFPATSTVTINVLDGGTNLVAGDIDNVNSSTVVINNATVTTLVNVKDNNAANLINARVLLEAADGAGDLTFEDVVTITRVTTIASVAHTAHGMVNGNKVVIRGADQQEYNGVFTISNVSANAYDYTVSGSPATPATGTITESGVILEGLTDASGNISDTRTVVLDTAVKGLVRKSTASPRFKSFGLAGTVDNVVGLTINVRMVLDE